MKKKTSIKAKKTSKKLEKSKLGKSLKSRRSKVSFGVALAVK